MGPAPLWQGEAEAAAKAEMEAAAVPTAVPPVAPVEVPIAEVAGRFFLDFRSKLDECWRRQEKLLVSIVWFSHSKN